MFSRDTKAPPSSPGNHWWSVSRTLDALNARQPQTAWQTLEGIRYSSLIPAQTIAGLEARIAETQDAQSRVPLRLPCDYLRTVPGCAAGLPPLNQLYASQPFLKNYPTELILPPITSNANDFAFIADSLARPEFTGLVPKLRLRLVICLSDLAEIHALSQMLEQMHTQLRGLDAVSFAVFAPSGLPIPSLPVPVSCHEGNPWQLDRSEQMARLASDTDVLLFTPLQALADPFMIERTLRTMALSDTLCLMLHWLVPHEPASAASRETSILSDQALQRPWRGKPAAFRSLDQLAFAVGAERFCGVGGFDPRFETEFFACREFGFRLHNKGSYFLPLGLRAEAPVPARAPDAPVDRDLLVSLVPHPWDRKTEGRFEVPKVSIYIPAYRAARYLREAIDSVLDQDFQDLEVCIADDGSPDNTLQVLESYKGDPRVRWTTGLNGGIGHASNRAIRMTRGLYIGQLDSDDRLKPGAIRRLVEALDENPRLGCAYGSCERVGPTGEFLRNEYNWPQFSREKMMLTSIAHHFRMFRRQVWERTEGFREDIVNAVDYDMFLKMSEVSEFLHVDELLYQRRWHGENTSDVNVAFQTQNTHRVQRDALRRLGLDRHWDVHVADPAKPREVTYRRTGDGHRVIFWPDYSRANPYQRLLYQKAREQSEVLGGDIDAALNAIRAVTPDESARVTFHLHWLNKILNDSQTLGEACDKAEAFLAKLKFFQFHGGRLVWTIHNTASHDLPFPQVEHNLAREIVNMADAVHIHCAESLPEIEAHFTIPHEKLHVFRHGSYVGTYPDFADRARARHELGLGADAEVMLFLGQIRPYKGLDGLVTAFRQIARHRPGLQLVLAGSGPVEALLAGLDDDLRSRVHVFNRFIDTMELQLFLHAADFAVLPYRNILTSGSLLLTLSFGVPTIVPGYGMTRTVLGGEEGDSDCGLTYPPEGGTSALTEAIRKMVSRLDAGEGPAMAAAARARAEAEPWEDIGPMLFGETP